MAALGHFLPFRVSLAQRQLLGAKQPLGTRILDGYDLNARERPLLSKADVQFLKINRI
jgi:hypothetical protein